MLQAGNGIMHGMDAKVPKQVRHFGGELRVSQPPLPLQHKLQNGEILVRFENIIA